MLRVSESTWYGPYDPIMHLSRSALSMNPPGFYRLHLICAKTDPFVLGCTVILGPWGRRICWEIIKRDEKALVEYLNEKNQSDKKVYRQSFF